MKSSIELKMIGREKQLPNQIKAVISSMEKLSSDNNLSELKSDQILRLVRSKLEKIGFKVEKSRKRVDQVPIVVRSNLHQDVNKTFYVDAKSNDGKILLEIEAGRAIENNQILKDLFEAVACVDVEYLILIVRKRYRVADFERTYKLVQILFECGRIRLPLKSVVVIGY